MNLSTKQDTSLIVEHTVLGNTLKVTVVDPVSMEEVSVIGPATSTSGQALEQMAKNKLKRKLQTL